MFDKIIEQSQQALKPMNELVALNAQVFEEVAEKQKDFFNGMMNDGLAYTKELGAQKDFSGVYQVQKTYWERCQDKLVNASTEAYEVWSRAQENAAEVMKGAGEDVQAKAAASAKKAAKTATS